MFKRTFEKAFEKAFDRYFMFGLFAFLYAEEMPFLKSSFTGCFQGLNDFNNLFMAK
ncbi:hypothetical protein [Pedobacter africanus]|uniref:hypothetical protein n=1 Tax=Pedobacter africanus TaxID=151894 RepID=UPI0033935DF0